MIISYFKAERELEVAVSCLRAEEEELFKKAVEGEMADIEAEAINKVSLVLESERQDLDRKLQRESSRLGNQTCLYLDLVQSLVTVASDPAKRSCRRSGGASDLDRLGNEAKMAQERLATSEATLKALQEAIQSKRSAAALLEKARSEQRAIQKELAKERAEVAELRERMRKEEASMRSETEVDPELQELEQKVAEAQRASLKVKDRNKGPSPRQSTISDHFKANGGGECDRVIVNGGASASAEAMLRNQHWRQSSGRTAGTTDFVKASTILMQQGYNRK